MEAKEQQRCDIWLQKLDMYPPVCIRYNQYTNWNFEYFFPFLTELEESNNDHQFMGRTGECILIICHLGKSRQMDTYYVPIPLPTYYT